MTVNTYIKPSPIHGVGLFADRYIKAGEEIIHAERFDLNRHIDEWIKYQKTTKNTSAAAFGWCAINHADKPNTHRQGELNIIATVDIAEGTEITEDYRALPDNQNPIKAEEELGRAFMQLETAMTDLLKRSGGK